MTDAENVIDRLRTGAKTLSTAESLTGGLVGETLTSISGSSAVYMGGVISYCNEIKHRILQVDAQDLSKLGAVSEPVAIQMAQGVRQLMQTDYAISTTGIAGPNSDETGKPVGLVYIAVSSCHGTVAQVLHLNGNRQEIREQTCQAALKLLLEQFQ